jgi:hypothetical protein
MSNRAIAVVLMLIVVSPLQAQQMPAFDPERIFMLGDADLDGMLTRDEYTELLRGAPGTAAGTESGVEADRCRTAACPRILVVSPACSSRSSASEAERLAA